MLQLLHLKYQQCQKRKKTLNVPTYLSFPFAIAPGSVMRNIQSNLNIIEAFSFLTCVL